MVNSSPTDAPLPNAPTEQSPSWRTAIAPYQRSVFHRSIWQIVNSVGGYALLWVLMYFTSRISFWLTVPLVILAGGFLVRIFIIFHDCTHNSFFRSQKANEFWGYVTGILCFTPFHHWKWEHAVHHAHSGDLDNRGLGDIWTLTVDEYLASSRFTRFRYRLNRNPIVLFVIAPSFLFFVIHRLVTPGASAKAARSVHLTTAAILALGCALTAIFGWKTYLLIQFFAMFIAASAGVWLFYIQHQFEGVEWERSDDWQFTEAALRGSSFYRLPRILQWFSGNIGFHHLHHLSPQIPNYNLEDCHETHPLFGTVPEITLRTSLKSFNFRLWDEKERRLVGFDHLRKIKSETSQGREKERSV
jgi:omega-6 fatty acid desaturase (delta-12 desaturase)